LAVPDRSTLKGKRDYAIPDGLDLEFGQLVPPDVSLQLNPRIATVYFQSLSGI
jgi:hypothetical protein